MSVQGTASRELLAPLDHSMISKNDWRAIATLVALLGIALIVVGATEAFGEGPAALFAPLGSGSALLVLAIALATVKDQTKPLTFTEEIRTTLRTNAKPVSRNIKVTNPKALNPLAESGVPSANLITSSLYVGTWRTLAKVCGYAAEPYYGIDLARAHNLPGLDIGEKLPPFTRVISISVLFNSYDNALVLPEGIQRLTIVAGDERAGWRYLRAHFEEAFAMMDAARAENSPLLLHCQCGVSRSVTLMVAYLVNRARVTVEEALDFVRLKRNVADPNDDFLISLHAYAREIGVE